MGFSGMFRGTGDVLREGRRMTAREDKDACRERARRCETSPSSSTAGFSGETVKESELLVDYSPRAGVETGESAGLPRAAC